MTKNNRKSKILITGVSGLLGNILARCLRDQYHVQGIYQDHPVAIEGVKISKVDICSKSHLDEIIAKASPDVLIHCASLTNIDFCEANRRLAEDVNVTGSRNIAESLEETACKLIYFSTDSVYDGVSGNFKENDPIAPRNHYGYTKYQGEQAVLKHAQALILRTNFFGWNIQNKDCFAELVIRELKDRRPLNGFFDTYFSSLYSVQLAGLLKLAISRHLSGVYNLGSADAITKYEFAVELANRLQLDASLIQKISIDDYPFLAQRGKNMSLNVEKICRDLNVELPTVRESIDAFCEDCQRGLPDRIKADGVDYRKANPSFLFYGKQCVDDEDIQAVVDVLTGRNLTQGPKIEEFESALCGAVDALHAVACNSGTSALHMACLAAGVQEGDEVITTPVTFVASANCAVYCGAKPIFADIDPQTYNISAGEIRRKITAKTKAVIPVHFAGQSCDMEAIRDVIAEAEKQYGHKIHIIEDACHALGSTYKNTKVGSGVFSDMTVMSFHPVKHITTGEGGVVFAQDPSLFKKLQLLRSHGITGDRDEFTNRELAFQADDPTERNPWYYEQIDIGYNYRITDIQCALGLSQMKKLEGFKTQRRELVNRYNELFSGHPLIHTPFEEAPGSSNFHLYVLRFDFHHMELNRVRLMLKLRIKGIQTQVHYIPVHLQSFYRRYGYGLGDYPVAEAYYANCLSIPLYPTMTQDDVDRVYHEISQLIGPHESRV